jgi:uncharacterized membrane protein YgaE (UPF0421/DUF939 family)
MRDIKYTEEQKFMKISFPERENSLFEKEDYKKMKKQTLRKRLAQYDKQILFLQEEYRKTLLELARLEKNE